MNDSPTRTFFATALFVPLILPLVIFFGVGVAEGMGVGGALTALVEQVGSRRYNPAITAGLGLIPVALLLGVLYVGGRVTQARSWVRAAGWGGLTGIVLVVAWAHLEFWPVFLPSRTSPGFPHGLELVIGPLFFAPMAALIGGVLCGVSAGRRA